MKSRRFDPAAFAAIAVCTAISIGCAQNGGTGDAGAPCAARDLGSRTGSLIVRGTTVGGTNQNMPSCSSGSSPDVAFAWQAPATGTYSFTTAGSEYDTVISVRSETCLGSELACNDDDNGARTSLVSVSLTAGQNIAILIDGFAGANGTFVLSITRQ